MHPPFASRLLHYAQKKSGLFNQSYHQAFFGREFVIPSINGRKTYHSEAWMADLIALLLPLKAGAFVDVGANLGQTLLKVAALDPTRAYLGFEPNPTCADYLFELISRNELPHVVIPAGLGTKADVLMLNMYRGESTDPSASLVGEFRGEPVSRKPVVVISWDDLPADVRPQGVGIVKIDVEGGEKEVLEGLAALITDQRPAILMEVLPPHRADNYRRIERQKAIEALLGAADYLIFRVIKGKTDNILGLSHVQNFGIHADLALCDYLLLHRSEGHLIENALVKSSEV